MKSTLKNMVIVLCSITTITAAAVGYVYKITKDPIAKTKEDNISKSLQDVLPKYETLDEPVMMQVYPNDTEQIKIYKAKNGDQIVGYAVES
ncbi:MAG: electron transporter RnfG, partial [Rikenellaceae bacterium]